MKKIIKLDEFKNKLAYAHFYDACVPICAMTRKMDITKLVRKRKKHKLNAMLCYCLQNAGQKNEIFHYSINNETSLFYCDKVCTNAVINGKDDNLYFVSVQNCETFLEYEEKYIQACQTAYNECYNIDVLDETLVATSTLVGTTMESFTSGFTKDFTSPFFVWGKYERKGFKYYLNVSLRFHHSIFVGKNISDFFNSFQDELDNFKI